jgi:hypothetical protein
VPRPHDGPLPSQVEVNYCPCGKPHMIARSTWIQFKAVTANLPGDEKVTVAGVGSWLVPRVYIAAHGLKAAGLPALAEQYGWPRVEGTDA